MAYFEELKRNIQVYFGSRGSVEDHKPGIIADLSKPKSIGLFFCISTRQELDMIRALLRMIRQRKEKASAYVFSHTREHIDVITDHSIIYFDLSDFTMTAKKKEQIAKIFMKDRPELFISFLSIPDNFCYRLASEIHAEFKVGPNIENYTGIYDLVLDANQKNFNYMKFYENVRHYLSVLNIKTR